MPFFGVKPCIFSRGSKIAGASFAALTPFLESNTVRVRPTAAREQLNPKAAGAQKTYRRVTWIAQPQWRIVEDKLEVKIRYWTIMKIPKAPTDAFWPCHSTPRHKRSTASRISSLEIS